MHADVDIETGLHYGDLPEYKKRCLRLFISIDTSPDFTATNVNHNNQKLNDGEDII